MVGAKSKGVGRVFRVFGDVVDKSTILEGRDGDWTAGREADRDNGGRGLYCSECKG